MQTLSFNEIIFMWHKHIFNLIYRGDEKGNKFHFYWLKLPFSTKRTASLNNKK